MFALMILDLNCQFLFIDEYRKLCLTAKYLYILYIKYICLIYKDYLQRYTGALTMNIILNHS